MIILPKERFVFVHIPKCAGTTIRHQLIAADDSYIAMNGIRKHPVLGLTNLFHVPLDILRDAFPENYQQLEEFDSFAIVRDPLDRFGSAMRQFLWRTEKKRMSMLSHSEMRERTLKMLDKVAEQIDAPSADYIFFARQKSFIDLEDRAVVNHLIPLEMTQDFLAYTARRTGSALDIDARDNRNVELRYKQLGRLAYGVNHMLWQVMPRPLHSRVKRTVLKVLAKSKDAAQSSGLLDLPELRDFVDAYYADDLRTYRSTVSRSATIAEGLSTGQLALVKRETPTPSYSNAR